MRLVDILVSDQGIFSEPVQSMASYIILFLLFGSILEESGAGKYFIDIAYAIGGRFTAGLAKTAAISSALFGSIRQLRIQCCIYRMFYNPPDEVHRLFA